MSSWLLSDIGAGKVQLVVIYKIDVDGMVEVLWPASRYSDGFVYGNHTYSIPRPGQGTRLRVGNVKGVEYVEAIASVYPFDLRALGIDFRFDPDDRAQHGYYVDGDPFLAVSITVDECDKVTSTASGRSSSLPWTKAKSTTW